MWKAVSISQGVPTILAPLIFVIFASSLKDALEDYARHQADKRENERQYWRVNPENPADTPFDKVLSLNLKVSGQTIAIIKSNAYMNASCFCCCSSSLDFFFFQRKVSFSPFGTLILSVGPLLMCPLFVCSFVSLGRRPRQGAGR